MSTIVVKDANGNLVYLGGTGAGTSGSAFVPSQSVSIVAGGVSQVGAWNVNGNTVRPSVGKTRPGNTSTYASGQIISESTSAGTVWTFSGVARNPGSTGTIKSAELADSISQSLRLQAQLYLFNVAPTTTIHDAQAWAPTYAEIQNCVGIMNMQTFFGGTTAGAGVLADYNETRKFACASGSQNLYGVLVAQNSYVPGSGEMLTLTLGVEQD